MLCHTCLCLQRVGEVYAQQCREVQDPQLPADTATALVGHMLALQAEGLPAAQVGRAVLCCAALRCAVLRCVGQQEILLRVIDPCLPACMPADRLHTIPSVCARPRACCTHPHSPAILPACLHACGNIGQQGQDPLALLLAAREHQFAADMSAAAADHERAVLRLKAAMAAAAGGDDKGQVGVWVAGTGHVGARAFAAMLTGGQALCEVF